MTSRSRGWMAVALLCAAACGDDAAGGDEAPMEALPAVGADDASTGEPAMDGGPDKPTPDAGPAAEDAATTPEPPDFEGWLRVAAGDGHTCAIASDHTLWCWGVGDDGSGNAVARPGPVQLGDDADWQEVAAGQRHGCGTRTPGSVHCWGDNGQGQLGDDGTTARWDAPAPIAGGSDDFEAVSAQAQSSCALDAAGSRHCWGEIGRAALGAPDASDRALALDDGLRWEKLALGTLSCGITDDGALWCWSRAGFDDNSPLPPGDGVGDHQDAGADDDAGVAEPGVLRRVGAYDDWTAVASGRQHTCAIRAGELYCLGENGFGQLGPEGPALGDTGFRRMGSDGGWSAVAVGDDHSCGIRDGSLYCWGRNDAGQKGVARNRGSAFPVQVGEAGAFEAVACGAAHSCGLRSDGGLWCWGQNVDGGVGVGEASAWRLPGQVVRPGPDD